VDCGSREAIEKLVPESEAHWGALAERALEIYREQPGDFATRVQDLLENNKLQAANQSS
jgi:hypothetical protein